MRKNQSKVLIAFARHSSLSTHHDCQDSSRSLPLAETQGFFAEFTLSVRPPVGGSIVPETSVCLYAESTTYVKFMESGVEGLSVRMTGSKMFAKQEITASQCKTAGTCWASSDLVPAFLLA